MGGRQLLTITFCSLVCLGYANTWAHAGWFGPSTYDECILDEMKGRPAYMMEIVKRDCTAKFCTEVPVTVTEEQKVVAKKASDECQSKAAAVTGSVYDRINAQIRCPGPLVSDTRLVCK